MTAYPVRVPGTLHVIHGYIGAGKTTFAKTLEQRGAVRFTPDEWMSVLYGVDPPAEFFAAYQERIRRLMEAQWQRLLELGIDVVLDSGCWKRAERDALRVWAQGLAAPFVLYDLSVPDLVAWQRVRRRNSEQPNHLYIDENTFWSLRKHFEPLAGDEVAVWVGQD